MAESVPALWWNVYVTGLPDNVQGRTIGGIGATPEAALANLREYLDLDSEVVKTCERLLDEAGRG